MIAHLVSLRLALILCSVTLALTACEKPPPPRATLHGEDFLWEAHFSRPILDPPMFRELTVEDTLRIQRTLDDRLTEITVAKPEDFGSTRLYFVLDSPMSAQVLVLSSEPLSARARKSLTPLQTEGAALYERALGIVRP